jgi:hypothetical protein
VTLLPVAEAQSAEIVESSIKDPPAATVTLNRQAEEPLL